MKGGEAVVETLITHGVDTAFTVPGESFLMPWRVCAATPIRFVSCRYARKAAAPLWQKPTVNSQVVPLLYS